MPEIIEAFKNQYQFDFSYDVEAIKNIKLDVDSGSISMDALMVLIKKQTQFILHKVDDYSYILIDNDKTIDICGFVIDSIDTFKLPEATIIKAKKVIKLTDSLGYFKLQLKSSDSISILHIGYETKTIKASDFSNSSCDTIRLQPDIQILNEVVINEYLTTGIQKNTDASINISTKKLRILPGLVEPDVLQSLQLVPGISSPTEDPAGLHIRGGTPDQNLVLWDGIKMYQSGHFFNQISTFNPYIVKNVKVYKGGTSVRYGDRVSGVVEIESDDDLTETLKIGGGANFTHTDVFAKVPLSEKVGVMGAFRRSTTDIYQNIGYNNLVKKVFQNTRADIPDDDTNERSREDDFSFSDANFKLIWNPNANNNLKFSAILAENKLDNTIPLDSTNSFSTKDIYKIRNAGASLNWRKKYSNNISQKTNFYVSSYKTRYSIARKLISDDENLNYDYTQNNDVKDIGLEYNLEIPITKKKALALGYQYTYNETIYKNREAITGDVEEAIDNYTTAYTNNHTLYSEYKYNGEKTYFNFGLRGSYLSRTNQTFIEPRIFSSVEVFKNFRITASAELKNQQLNTFSDAGSVSPSIRGLPVTDNIWILSGETTRDEETFFIPVLKSRQFTLGALYSYKGWNFDLEGYYKKLIDITANNIILDFISLSEENDRGAIDLGTEERIGFDFLIKKRIQNYRFWLGYSLSKSVVSFPALQQKSYPGNFNRPHEFNISQTLKINNFEFALGWNYATGTPFTKLIPDENSFAGRMIDPNGINAKRFKDYHRLDASAVYRFNFKTKKTWGGMIGFSLRNIYNRKNTINQGFIEVGEDDIMIDTFERKSLRLTPDMVIRFNF
ncbi:TonB-dependent receptor plug domain-containing protein [uncultured Algibacter sp.]|uniref:TonB-dependent receptor n=1 Tax=uncultured Algibacter sp. TaxID=298659 RepID=UPI0032174E9F